MTRVGQVLRKRPLELASGLTCSVGHPMVIRNSPDYQSVVTARQLDYCFDPARSKRDKYAWPGLETYGPFSRDTFARPTPRILVSSPRPRRARPRNSSATSAMAYPGSRASRPVSPRPSGSSTRASTWLPSPDRHRPPPRVTGRPSRRARQSELPDAAIVIVTDRDGDLPDGHNPYLHSKAMLLMAGVAAQHARLSKITASLRSRLTSCRTSPSPSTPR